MNKKGFVPIIVVFIIVGVLVLVAGVWFYVSTPRVEFNKTESWKSGTSHTLTFKGITAEELAVKSRFNKEKPNLFDQKQCSDGIADRSVMWFTKLNSIKSFEFKIPSNARTGEYYFYVVDGEGRCAYSDYVSIINDPNALKDEVVIISTPEVISPANDEKWIIGETNTIRWEYPKQLIDEINLGKVSSIVVRINPYSSTRVGFIIKKSFKDSNSDLLNFTSYEWKVGTVTCYDGLDGKPCKTEPKVLLNTSYMMMVCKEMLDKPRVPYCGAMKKGNGLGTFLIAQ